MRIIAIAPIREFWLRHPRAEIPLRSWYALAKRAAWRTPAEVKAAFGSVSVIANNRLVFNIKGNDYRLVVAMRYERGMIYIRFVGTHAEYDRIDATRI